MLYYIIYTYIYINNSAKIYMKQDDKDLMGGLQWYNTFAIVGRVPLHDFWRQAVYRLGVRGGQLHIHVLRMKKHGTNWERNYLKN